MPAVKKKKKVTFPTEHMMIDVCHCFIPLSSEKYQFRNRMQKIDQNLNEDGGIAVTWGLSPKWRCRSSSYHPWEALSRLPCTWLMLLFPGRQNRLNPHLFLKSVLDNQIPCWISNRPNPEETPGINHMGDALLPRANSSRSAGINTGCPGFWET